MKKSLNVNASLGSKYRAIDEKFLHLYPQGFQTISWQELAKKHVSFDKIKELIAVNFDKQYMQDLISNEAYTDICNFALKIVKRSSVISVFEKITFQNYLKNQDTHFYFATALFNLFHNYSKESFTTFVEVLEMLHDVKAAKWPIVSFFVAYIDVDRFIIVKPTTSKAIAKLLDIDIGYTPRPNFDTYSNIVAMIKEYHDNSKLCSNQNLIKTQAVLYSII